MQADRIPGEIGQAVVIAHDLAERAGDEGRARRRSRAGRQAEADAIFEPMQPGPVGSQAAFVVDGQAPVPQRVDDVIEALAERADPVSPATTSARRRCRRHRATSCSSRTSIRGSAIDPLAHRLRPAQRDRSRPPGVSKAASATCRIELRLPFRGRPRPGCGSKVPAEIGARCLAALAGFADQRVNGRR